MAVRLAEQGYDVAIHYASSDAGAQETLAQVQAVGRSGAVLKADLLDDAATQGLFDKAVSALGGPLTCLINNASIFEYDSLLTATPESWERHMASNFRAPFWLTQKMAQQGLSAATDGAGEPEAAGLIINMIDQRVRKVTPEFMTYSLAKMGLWALTQSSAQALAPSIRVNAIGPGPTLRGGRQSEAHFAKQRAATVLGRGANVSDITAALDYFLISPAITGQLLCVDGGQHLAWETPDVIGVE